MQTRCVWLIFFACGVGRAAGAAEPAIVVSGLQNPQSIVATDDGRMFVTVQGQPGQTQDGAVLRIDQDHAIPFASGLDDPTRIAAFNEWLYVLDGRKVWRIDRSGKATVFANASKFFDPKALLSGLTIDVESGSLYVSDVADKATTLYRISSRGSVVRLEEKKAQAAMGRADAILLDGASHLLMLDRNRGKLSRLKLLRSSVTSVVDGLSEPAGMIWDVYGRLYLSELKGGRILAIARAGEKPVELASGFQAPNDVCVDRAATSVFVVDSKAGTVSKVSATISGFEVDRAPLPVRAVPAFTKLQWAGWTGETPQGTPAPLRPIVLTHAGDGSNRAFVATEQGVIHVFPNDPEAKATKVFLDLQDRVRYDDKENEEGFLGLAFHPRFKETGELFVFYTSKKEARSHVNILSRFRVRKDDPTQADPASEEVLMSVAHPFWNHDGGTIAFGPDGYLYLALGDGGAANDPFGNGQNLETLLGSVLRIDIDKKGTDTPYAIPPDNPFVGRSNARPEIWSYGLRNVWRFAFDRKTGACWAADVGQNLWEEIDLLVPGGNFGWSLREGFHPFGVKGVGPRKDLIDPIWEYHHSIGKSITGGGVYRGKSLPELDGAYLYADYVSGQVSALRYDPAKRRVIANQPIASRNLPVLSFGEDEAGEMYFLTVAADGRGLWRFERSGGK